jgi:hypothetical protein
MWRENLPSTQWHRPVILVNRCSFAPGGGHVGSLEVDVVSLLWGLRSPQPQITSSGWKPRLCGAGLGDDVDPRRFPLWGHYLDGGDFLHVFPGMDLHDIAVWNWQKSTVDVEVPCSDFDFTPWKFHSVNQLLLWRFCIVTPTSQHGSYMVWSWSHLTEPPHWQLIASFKPWCHRSASEPPHRSAPLFSKNRLD